MLFFFFCEPQLFSFTFKLRLLYELKCKVHHLLCVGFSIFDCLVFIKIYIFVPQKAWTLWLWTVIITFKIKIIQNPHTLLLPDLWFLSWNKNIWYFNDICVSWRSPETGDELFTLRKLKFWVCQIFSIVTFK